MNFINTVTFLTLNGKEKLLFSSQNNRIAINSLPSSENNSFTIEIEFSSKIKQIRMPDYSWSSFKESIIPQFCNQIIQLENGIYLQSETPIGIWEFKKNKPNFLYWKINPLGAFQLTNYQGEDSQKFTEDAKCVLETNQSLALLFSSNGAIEVSRSAYPFSSILCFTDHCDFDTVKLLQKQRLFFKEKGIKTTKGIFLNHFSKREDNACWQNDSEELTKWLDDEHELCYHSLSQSLKSKQESITDFFNFTPPTKMPVWIDHGYQYYNVSLYKKEGISEVDYAKNLNGKKIKIIWNYIDSGTTTSGVINQLNPKHFNLKSFYHGIKNKPLKIKIALLIKNSIVHFYANEELIKNYTFLASNFKKASQSKSIKDIFNFVKMSFKVIMPLFKIALFWSKYKDKTYPLAKYSPTFFEHIIANEKFIVFQTVELVDFISTFNKSSIDILIKENGLCIAHTYFAVPMAYHDGKIFLKNEEINPLVDKNFDYIRQKINEKRIWNPTLSQLADYWIRFQNMKLRINSNNDIVMDENAKLHYRKIK